MAKTWIPIPDACPSCAAASEVETAAEQPEHGWRAQHGDAVRCTSCSQTGTFELVNEAGQIVWTE